ncbi:hypothetical protein AS593_19750 [Caulobacter vibrioides]|nr:hypothetical protein AS593_19750 [Caulobacter vibrioides]
MNIAMRAGPAMGLILLLCSGAAMAQPKTVYSDKALSVEQLEALFGDGKPAAKPLRFRATPEFGASARPAASAAEPASAAETQEAFSLSYPIEFEVNSAEVEARWMSDLRPLAQYLLRHPDAAMLVIGHTDQTGAPAYNQRLSERRAAAVRSVLIAQGVPAERLTSLGKGQTSPMPNEPPDSARNRRVEFRKL